MTQLSPYRVEDEILTRIRLYDYSTGKQTFFSWQAGMLPAITNKRVLELGCGNGELWRTLLPRWTGCDVTLTDISEAMLANARELLSPFGDLVSDITFERVDLNALPYEDQQFDVIIANHILFYADDIQAVLGRIARCLAPGGLLVCSTVGADHLHQLAGTIQQLGADPRWAAKQYADVFGLDNGTQQLASHFTHVDQFEYDNNLHVTSVEPLIAYLKKTMKGQMSDWVTSHEKSLEGLLARQIDRKGYFRLTPHSGFFMAYKSAPF